MSELSTANTLDRNFARVQDHFCDSILSVPSRLKKILFRKARCQVIKLGILMKSAPQPPTAGKEIGLLGFQGFF